MTGYHFFKASGIWKLMEDASPAVWMGVSAADHGNSISYWSLPHCHMSLNLGDWRCNFYVVVA
jgi:hypothetical protein